jgi:hypothetical protein
MNIHDFVAVVNKYNLKFSCMDFQQYNKFKNGLPDRSRFIPVLFEIYGTSKLKSHYEKNVLEIIFVTNINDLFSCYFLRINSTLIAFNKNTYDSDISCIKYADKPLFLSITENLLKNCGNENFALSSQIISKVNIDTSLINYSKDTTNSVLVNMKNFKNYISCSIDTCRVLLELYDIRLSPKNNFTIKLSNTCYITNTNVAFEITKSEDSYSLLEAFSSLVQPTRLGYVLFIIASSKRNNFPDTIINEILTQISSKNFLKIDNCDIFDENIIKNCVRNPASLYDLVELLER